MRCDNRIADRLGALPPSPLAKANGLPPGYLDNEEVDGLMQGGGKLALGLEGRAAWA